MGTSWASDGIGQNINNTRDKPVFLLFGPGARRSVRGDRERTSVRQLKDAVKTWNSFASEKKRRSE